MEPFMLQYVDELVAQRPPAGQEPVHFTESLATAVIAGYSFPDGRVLDPFAGFGTTLVVAERLSRHGIGVELLPERVAQIRERIRTPGDVIGGDARDLAGLVATPFELCFTSPPYMTSNAHPENPLDAYETQTGDYGGYLRELGDVFAQVARLLVPGGHLVINVANTLEAGVMTPLAWDLAHLVSRHLALLQECFLCWDRQPPGITGDYCLVFQRQP